MITAAHCLSLTIYMIIIFQALRTLFYIKRCHKLIQLQITLTLFLLLSIFQASTFIYLQIDWVISNHDQAVGEQTSFLWLLFDYFNGLALLMYVTAINIYLRWRCTEERCINYRRRRSDA